MHTQKMQQKTYHRHKITQKHIPTYIHTSINYINTHTDTNTEKTQTKTDIGTNRNTKVKNK